MKQRHGRAREQCPLAREGPIREGRAPRQISEPSWICNGKHQSDRMQVIGGRLLIGQLAPWVTSGKKKSDPPGRFFSSEARKNKNPHVCPPQASKFSE